MQGHTEKPNTQEQQKFSTATAAEASTRSGDSTDIQRISANSSFRDGELHLDGIAANIPKPLCINCDINCRPQPHPLLAGNMPSSLTSTLTSGSTSSDKIHQHEPAKQRPQHASRRGSAYPDQCWNAGDAALGSSGHGSKTLVLCFDGTGNKFKGNSGDTNILKIFSMLDRRKGDQYHYYQREFITLLHIYPTHWVKCLHLHCAAGIGTYLTSHAMVHRTSKGRSGRFKSAYQKAIDAAVGKSFDQHVMGGYRFLMRYYHPGDDIYMFGFSRGAYTARFLCEMLDHVGLVVQGNEEMVHFAWKTFSQWQMRAHDNHNDREKRRKEELYNYMKAFRETFTRPVKRVRFLGLFDTVNSVARFEDAWLKRASRFPYTARSTARVIRHAVGLDERRAKFRQDLVEKVDLAELNDSLREGGKKRRRSWGEKEKQFEAIKAGIVKGPILALNGKAGGEVGGKTKTPPDPSLLRMGLDQAGASNVSLNIHFDREDGDDDDTEQDVEELWFPGAHGDIGGGWDLAPGEPSLSYGPLVWMVREARKAGLVFDERRLKEQDCYTDLDAMYGHEQGEPNTSEAAVGHPTIEVQKATPSTSPLSAEDAVIHPLSSAQTRANGAGRRRSSTKSVSFDAGRVGETGGDSTFGSISDDEADLEVYAVRFPPSNHPHGHLLPFPELLRRDQVSANFKKNPKQRGSSPPATIPTSGAQGSATSSSRNISEQGVATTPRPITHSRTPPHRDEVSANTAEKLKASYTRSKIHCCLTFGGGLPHMSTLGWRMMEYLPFRRMDLQKDGSWKAISWPLPMGEVRDVPEDAKIHCSVLHRMRADSNYRPGNLLVGGGGRGVRVAPPEYQMGEWVVLREEGSLVGEVLVKKSRFYPKEVATSAP